MVFHNPEAARWSGDPGIQAPLTRPQSIRSVQESKSAPSFSRWESGSELQRSFVLEDGGRLAHGCNPTAHLVLGCYCHRVLWYSKLIFQLSVITMLLHRETNLRERRTNRTYAVWRKPPPPHLVHITHTPTGCCSWAAERSAEHK